MPESINDCARSVLPWAAFYAGIFAFSRLLSPKIFLHVHALSESNRSYWAASIVSTANALVLVPMASMACSEAGLLAVDASFTVTTPLSTTCCHAMLGYIAWDTLPLLWYARKWSGSGVYLLHHAGSLAGWGTAVMTGVGHNMALPMQLLEVTAPFTNLRWFLATAGMKNTKLYIANGVAMFLSFLAARIIFILWLYVVRFGIQHDSFRKMPGWLQADAVIVFTLNLVLQFTWFSKISKAIRVLLIAPPKSSGKAL